MPRKGERWKVQSLKSGVLSRESPKDQKNSVQLSCSLRVMARNEATFTKDSHEPLFRVNQNAADKVTTTLLLR